MSNLILKYSDDDKVSLTWNNKLIGYFYLKNESEPHHLYDVYFESDNNEHFLISQDVSLTVTFENIIKMLCISLKENNFKDKNLFKKMMFLSCFFDEESMFLNQLFKKNLFLLFELNKDKALCYKLIPSLNDEETTYISLYLYVFTNIQAEIKHIISMTIDKPTYYNRNNLKEVKGLLYSEINKFTKRFPKELPEYIIDYYESEYLKII